MINAHYARDKALDWREDLVRIQHSLFKNNKLVKLVSMDDNLFYCEVSDNCNCGYKFDKMACDNDCSMC